ncbi:MAG: peptidoglycan-associated lipoprotein [Saprospiraceae bacterium]|jgi:peptidoglycan-associated lipoprotein
MKNLIAIFIWSLLLVAFACSTTKKIKDGSTAYQQKQYAVAIEMLEREIIQYEEGEEYAKLAFMLGQSYKNLNDSKSSLKWLIQAAKNNYGPAAYLQMAQALKKSERYDDAILTYQRLLKFTERQNDIKLEIEKCRQAKKWVASSSDNPYEIEALSLNSATSDYAPTLWQEDRIVFTSDRGEIDSDEDAYLWTGNAYSDLYVAGISDLQASIMEGGINTSHNEGTATFNKEGDRVFFTRCQSEIGDSYCKIWKATWSNGDWIDQEEAFTMKPRVNYRDPVLIENDSVLILVSDDPTGIGGSDLYVSFLNEDGSWEAPELMPPYLNTIGEERFPTWDGEILYYSSDHFPGLGGLDIFRTKLKEDNSWSGPQNLLQPFNSSEDDYSYTVVSEGALPDDLNELIFFTTTRGVFGNDDLYAAKIYKTAKDTIVIPTTEIEVVVEEEKKEQFLRIMVSERLFAVPDNPNSFVVGAKPVSNASVKVSGSISDQIVTTDDNGFALLPIDTFGDFNLLAGKRGYLNNRDDYLISEELFESKPDGYVHEAEIIIEMIFEGVEITLDNIYYDFNEDFIREDAKPALNYLIDILSDNANISITLSSHTDCRGDTDLNQDLSQRRAASAINYIRDQGVVDPSRLSAVGYGKSKPEINCECESCTEEEHQVNRRTTFSIIQ